MFALIQDDGEKNMKGLHSRKLFQFRTKVQLLWAQICVTGKDVRDTSCETVAIFSL